MSAESNRTKQEVVDILNTTGSQAAAGRAMGVCRQRVGQLIKKFGIKVKKVEKFVPVSYTYKVKKTIATYF